MNGELISIIVPAFNSGLYIIENIESIKNQTYDNWEAIIVDDGSTDDTKKIVQQYIGSDNRYTLISTSNFGVSAARNTGILNSKGHYIFPLDSDNILHESCLERCVIEFEKNKNTRLVYTEANLIGSEHGLWNLPAFHYKTMLKFNMIDNSALYLRKDFDRVGGYRTNMVHGLEDWDFFIALLYGCNENEVIKIPDPLYYYRVNESGRRLTVANNGRQKSMLDLLIYNNYSIYQEYFPDIFKRVHEFDFDKVILNKAPIKFITKSLIRLSSLKNKLGKW